jgi:hypothetical protein
VHQVGDLSHLTQWTQLKSKQKKRDEQNEETKRKSILPFKPSAW